MISYRGLRSAAGAIAAVIVLGIFASQLVRMQTPQVCSHPGSSEASYNTGEEIDLRGFCRSEMDALSSHRIQDRYLHRMADGSRMVKDVTGLFCGLLMEPNYRPTLEEYEELVDRQIPQLTGVSGLDVQACHVEEDRTVGV